MMGQKDEKKTKNKSILKIKSYSKKDYTVGFFYFKQKN
jgi:hypothetical protein